MYVPVYLYFLCIGPILYVCAFRMYPILYLSHRLTSQLNSGSAKTVTETATTYAILISISLLANTRAAVGQEEARR